MVSSEITGVALSRTISAAIWHTLPVETVGCRSERQQCTERHDAYNEYSISIQTRKLFVFVGNLHDFVGPTQQILALKCRGFHDSIPRIAEYFGVQQV